MFKHLLVVIIFIGIENTLFSQTIDNNYGIKLKYS